MSDAALRRLLPLVGLALTAQLLLGALLAKGWALTGSTFTAGLIFVGLVGGGSLALDAAFAPGAMSAPPWPPSAHRKPLAASGFVLLAAGLLWSSVFLRVKPGGKYFFEIVMTCVLMSLLYSLPPIRLKARPGWELLLVSVGFGFFTPMAGWCATGRGLEGPLLDLCIGFLFLFLALHPLLQIPRNEAPIPPGESTMLQRLGVARSLSYALGATLVAHLYFANALLHAGRPAALTPLLISLLAWVGVLLPWRLRWQHWTVAQSQQALVRALAAWAITDLSLLILLWPR